MTQLYNDVILLSEGKVVARARPPFRSELPCFLPWCVSSLYSSCSAACFHGHINIRYSLLRTPTGAINSSCCRVTQLVGVRSSFISIPLLALTMAKHYVTGEFPKRAPVRLNDEEYGRCLDAIVKACVDVVIVHSRTKQVLLGNRRVHPQPGLWFIGGRMIPGESPEETAARHVRHDTTLALPPSSFSFVCVSSYLWAMRHQPPAENGTADIALTYFCFVDDEQAARIECGNKAECVFLRLRPACRCQHSPPV